MTSLLTIFLDKKKIEKLERLAESNMINTSQYIRILLAKHLNSKKDELQKIREIEQ